MWFSENYSRRLRRSHTIFKTCKLSSGIFSSNAIKSKVFAGKSWYLIKLVSILIEAFLNSFYELINIFVRLSIALVGSLYVFSIYFSIILQWIR
jgi:hypothetical protein